MAKQPPDTPAARETIPPARPAESEIDRNASFRDEQIGQLRDMVGSLTDAVTAMQARNAQKAAFDDTVAELKQTARALAVAPVGVATAAAPGVRDHGGDCGCDCVSPGCCAFDIVLSRVRAAKPQIEPADKGDIPGFINALEVQIYVTVDNVGFLFPGLATTMDLRADGAPGGPGPWVVIERTINRVYVPRTGTTNFEVFAQVREHDEGVERIIGLKDEVGEGSGWIALDCCTNKIYPATPIDVYLQHGGEGRGMVQLAFYARRVCC